MSSGASDGEGAVTKAEPDKPVTSGSESRIDNIAVTPAPSEWPHRTRPYSGYSSKATLIFAITFPPPPSKSFVADACMPLCTLYVLCLQKMSSYSQLRSVRTSSNPRVPRQVKTTAFDE